MIDGSGSVLVLVLAVCGALGVWGVVREARHPAGHVFRRLRLAAGLSLMAFAIAGGNFVIRQASPELVEPRGYGVVVEGVAPSYRRDFDVGLALAQGVVLESCDDDETSRVTLQIAPTAAFWVDNRVALMGSTDVRVLIPLMDAQDIAVSQGRQGIDPFTRPVDSSSLNDDDLRPSYELTDTELGVEVKVTVDAWATSREPIRITYTSHLTKRRGLGSCYVNLPALTGLPTVISGAALKGLAQKTVEGVQSDPRQDGLFFVSSAVPPKDGKEHDETREDRRYAYYDPSFEITRGVTVVQLQGELVEGRARPEPNANFAGSPAWTCKSTVAGNRRFIEDEIQAIEEEADQERAAAQREARKPAQRGEGQGGAFGDEPSPTEQEAAAEDEDAYFSTSRDDDGTYALSRARVDEVLAQSDCAAQVQVEATSAGSQRDAVVLFIGALFSAGVTWVSTSVRRRRVAPAQAPTARSASAPALSAATRRMLATMARAGQPRRRRTDTTPDPPEPPTPHD